MALGSPRTQTRGLQILESQFNAADYSPVDQGSIKVIYSLDQMGSSVKGDTKPVFALGVLKESSESTQALLSEEIHDLGVLKAAGLPVVDVLKEVFLPEGKQGYLMPWIADAIQVEAKTPSSRTTNAAILAVLINDVAPGSSSEMGRIRLGSKVSAAISAGKTVNFENAKTMLADLRAIKKYMQATYINDLQIMLQANTGRAIVIDPMGLMSRADLQEASSDLRNFATTTQRWMTEMMETLRVVLTLQNMSNKDVRERTLLSLIN
ncbi:MAG: hypothetical protein ACI9BD_001159 [Candidatus Marinamargulisbacteria bacterium]